MNKHRHGYRRMDTFLSYPSTQYNALPDILVRVEKQKGDGQDASTFSWVSPFLPRRRTNLDWLRVLRHSEKNNLEAIITAVSQKTHRFKCKRYESTAYNHQNASDRHH